MITKFKIFENNSKLEVGDYVLIHTEATNETIRNFVNSTIGQIKKIYPDKIDMWGHVSVGNIVVKYKNVPKGYTRWFNLYIRGLEKRKEYLRQFHPSQVVAFGKTTEELELKLNIDKYNL